VATIQPLAFAQPEQDDDPTLQVVASAVNPQPCKHPHVEETADPPGLAPPDSDRIRVTLSFMGGYIHDSLIASLGYEKQGRIGYGIVNVSGKLTNALSYVFEINPVNESSPLPTCGEDYFFYPNTPQNFGPRVQCHPDGRSRVDDYRSVALDPMNQQGAIRQAYFRYDTGGFGLQFGCFVLPLGFGWEEVDSFTTKDAPHIQRINAESNFGLSIARKFWTSNGNSRHVPRRWE
jgi:hypothetical protein